jgi:hypothetical protein
MDLDHVTYQGPAIDDLDVAARVPEVLRNILLKINGFIQFGGGFHIRGACREPLWHSLSRAWSGPLALFQLFPAVKETDVPFAQDCLGDQYLLRDGRVVHLQAETGEVHALPHSLLSFIEAIQCDPVETLKLQPLLAFWQEGGGLRSGQLLSVYPPFCAKESAAGVNYRAVSAEDRLGFLSSLAREIGI